MSSYLDGRNGGGRKPYQGDCDLCGKKSIGRNSNSKLVPSKVICNSCVSKIKYKGKSTRPVRAKWSYEKCKEIALEFSHIKDLRGLYPALYATIHKNNWQDVFSHMTPLGSLRERYIYVYEHSDNTAYVGLTYNPEKRHRDHMARTKVLIEKAKSTVQTYKLLHGPVSKDEIGKLEVATIQEYADKGWTMLNVAKGGSLGNKDRIWSVEIVRELALSCSSRSEFIDKYTSAYQWCFRNGKIEEVCTHLVSKSKPEWSSDQITAIAASCPSYTYFYTNYKGCYLSARRQGILELVKLVFKKEENVTNES